MDWVGDFSELVGSLIYQSLQIVVTFSFEGMATFRNSKHDNPIWPDIG